MEVNNDVRFNGNLTEYETFKITYSGKLFKNNSEEVTIVFGFGPNWENTTELLMEKTENGFVADINILNFDAINFCFKNSNMEWDNNNSINYVVPILPPCLPTFNEEVEIPTEQAKDNVLKYELESLLDELLTPMNVQEFKTLDELLNPVNVQENVETAETIDQSFDIDTLIENILNPVINIDSSKVLENASTDLPVDNITESNYVSEITDTTALTVTEDESFLVSPRKLGAFYMIRKKIKLALYKALVAVPKLLMGEYDTNKND